MARRTRSAGRSAAPRASSRARTAPSRSAMSASRASPPPAPRRSASTAPVPQKKPSASPPANPQQPQGSAAGGFMANVASTGLGVMAGRAMDRAFFGGGGANAAPPEELPPQESSETYENWEGKDQIPETICSREALEFKKCMERNGSDVASCQWNLDILAACQRQSHETGFADAGRL